MKNLEQTTGLLGSLPPSETLGSLEKGIKLAQQGIEVCMLSVGEPDFDTPEPIKQAAASSLMGDGRRQFYMILNLQFGCEGQYGTGKPPENRSLPQLPPRG